MLESSHLSGIDNVAIFPIISMVIFGIVFISVLVWVVRIKKDYVDHMEDLPLTSDGETINKGNNNE
ncbi:MAG: cbb3-type cytochrome c oxidase subunit 3 [Ignavibacteria bacterium]|nr:cbb3-type cytochrome c oxidase subunit 3 [Ignavibacteria bacterium]